MTSGERPLRVGVVGAGGEIGRCVVAALPGCVVGPEGGSGSLTVVAAARRPDPLGLPLPEQAGVRFEQVVLDLHERDRLARFAAGLDLVVNAAGPSHAFAEETAAVVLGEGADYVDVGGPADTRCGRLAPVAGRTALFHAGALPGAAGVVPRWTLLRHPGARTLTVVTGGRGAFTRAGAEDYLAGLTRGDVEPLAAWRDGRRVAAAAQRQAGVVLEELPDPVALSPYLDSDAEDLAETHGLVDATWYSAMAGAQVMDVLMLATGMGLVDGSRLLRDASTALLAGRRPYVVVLVVVETERVMLRAPGEAALAGRFAAVVAAEVLAGRVPEGVFPAARAVDPARVVPALTRPGGGCTLTTSAGGDLDLMEEGAL